MPAALKTLLLSLLAFIGALLTLALVSTVASWLPPLLGLRNSSTLQLGWDLVFTVLAGIAAVGFASYHAPRWPRLHGLAVWLLITVAAGWACLDMGNDFPRWFVVPLLVSLPLQLLAGLALGARRARTATRP